MKRIGLTGGIGTGKSTVARLFRELSGAEVLDADEIARSLRAPGGSAEPVILKRFGTLDRTRLRALISSDPKAKSDLEAILHPLIRQRSDEEMARIARENPNAPFLIYEASLLIESGRHSDFDAVIVVTAPLTERITRVMNRDGISKEAALALIHAQSSDEFRLEHADYSVDNTGNLNDLRVKVSKIVDQIRLS